VTLEPDTGSSPPRDLAQAGAHGALWQGLAQVIGKSVVLLTTIVLARLLSPHEYGLVALALVLMTYAATLADAGVAQALVYLPRNAESARAALFASVSAGLVIALAVTAAAPLIADFFDNPEVAPLVRLLALSLLATSVGAVPESLLRRLLEFRRLTIATVTRAIVTGAVTLSLALAGYGAWSLAVGTVAGALAYTAACWLLLPDHVPLQLWRVRRSELVAVVRYGAPVAGSTLLGRLIFDVDYVVIGRLLGAGALGYYTLAFRLPEFVIINIFLVLTSVMFPLYTHARGEPERLRRGYLKSLQVQALYGVTAGVGLAVVAPYVVPLVFGTKWLPTVVPLAVLALYAAVRSLGAGANEVYKALGRPGLSIVISLVRLAILLPALIVATRWGIVGVAWAQLIVAGVFAIGMQTVAARVMGSRARDVVTAVAPPLLCGAVVAVVGLIGRALPLGTTASLVVTVCAAVAAVVLFLRLAYPSILAELLRLVRSGARNA
jgi:lipopolysaccharide exporter